jgi:hypothetical protein
MKNLIPAMLAVAMIALPLGAIAGEPSAPMMMGPGMGPVMAEKLQLTPDQQRAWQQAMMQSMQQVMQLHQQARARILGTLTPAHRTLLGQVAGNLATSVNPDYRAAAQQLNAALSPGESQQILSIHSSLEQQSRTIFESMHQKFLSMLTPQQRSQIAAHENGESKEMHEMHAGMPGMEGMERHQLTAGDVLLHLMVSGGHDVMFMHGVHR